jgi:NAD(P)-dependent dehydrogenase (short-subunit alcohol dehydrogenase family)
MKGKVVLVTGANGGLGTYVTQAFLGAGATVIGTSRKIQQSDFNDSNFTAVPAEISSREGAKVLVDQVVARFGKLDVLAHTVGGFAGGQSIADTDDATFQRMFDLNLNCVFHVLRAAIPPLRKTGDGRVIAIGSRAALEPGAGVGAYSASKAAMVSLLKTVALENKDGNRVATQTAEFRISPLGQETIYCNFKFPDTTGDFLLRAIIDYRENNANVSTQSRRYVKLVKSEGGRE